MLNWQLKRFDELDIHNLYALLKLRCDVFVVEQDCPYPELDNIDQTALHLLGWHNTELTAYLRIFKPDATAQEVKIGRVVTAEQSRYLGFGRELMLQGFHAVEAHFPQHNIRISAQQRLHDFYASLGFEVVSEPYDEDGIPHIAMLKLTKVSEV